MAKRVTLTAQFSMEGNWVERELAIERVLDRVSTRGGSDGVTRTLEFDLPPDWHDEQAQERIKRAIPGVAVLVTGRG